MEKSSGILNFAKGETIIREGDPGTVMFIIEEGEVEIAKGDWRLGTLAAGDFFGEMSVIDDVPRGATARALTDCQLLEIDRSTFDQLLRRFPEVSIRMLRRMAARMREAEAAAEAAQMALSGGQPAGARAPVRPVEAPSEPQARAEQAVAPGSGGTWRLVCPEQGVEFVLVDQPEIRIGRFDAVSGVHPEVDLTKVDTRRTTSRRHARIVREADRLFVSEEIATANGTFVNGTRIACGDNVEIKDGDSIRFGKVETLLKAER